MKAFRYAVLGLIVGATLGAILGSGQLFTRARTKKVMTEDFSSWQWAFCGAVAGAVILGGIGARTERKEKVKREKESLQRERNNSIRSALGLKPYPPVEVIKEGHSPILLTRWVDPRNLKTYVLKTYRNEKGKVVSTLSGLTLVHDMTSPTNGEEEITAAHGNIRVMIFQGLISAFEQDKQIAVEDVFGQK